MVVCIHITYLEKKLLFIHFFIKKPLFNCFFLLNLPKKPSYLFYLSIYILLSQLQHLGSFSTSLNTGNAKSRCVKWSSHLQHSTVGLHPGFSHTSSHFGLGHSGLMHFQSQLGSSQTASQMGFGDC